MSIIGGLRYYLRPHRFTDISPAVPGTDYGVFDMYCSVMVPYEVSTSSQAYVLASERVRHTSHRYGFPLLGTLHNYQEFYSQLRTSDAGVTAYVRYLRDATVMAESSTNSTVWEDKVYLVEPPYNVIYTYTLELRIAGVAVAYLRRAFYVRATFFGHRFYVWR